MAKREADPWRRKRLEEEEEENKHDILEETLSGRPENMKLGSLDAGTEKLLELVKRASLLIEQVNNLYNQYFSGAEKRPPVEQRKQLDQIMATILVMGKPTQAIQFRCSNLQMNYSTYRERWDRKLRALEAGKLSAHPLKTKKQVS